LNKIYYLLRKRVDSFYKNKI